jgi:hypothetical protein
VGSTSNTHEVRVGNEIPPVGARIERPAGMGRSERGTVFYSDELQILVKWDGGRSQSLTPGVDRFRIIDPD